MAQNNAEGQQQDLERFHGNGSFILDSASFQAGGAFVGYAGTVMGFRSTSGNAWLWLISVCSLVAVAVGQGSECPRAENLTVPKIKGGVKAPVCRFPYMVSLRNADGDHHCGGQLVHPLWVLTAAHCVDPEWDKALTTSPVVATGPYFADDDDKEKGVKVMLGEAFPHPKYDGDYENGFDVALVRLPEEVDITPIRLPLPSYVLHADRKTVALGWGKTGEKKLRPNQPLLMVNLSAIDQEDCKEELGDSIKPNMVCAYSETGDTCEGDSGGPLIVPHNPKSGLEDGNPSLDLLVGIVSFGQGTCEDSTSPGVYTKVAAFSKWVNMVIEGGDPTQDVESDDQTGAEETSDDADVASEVDTSTQGDTVGDASGSSVVGGSDEGDTPVITVGVGPQDDSGVLDESEEEGTGNKEDAAGADLEKRFPYIVSLGDSSGSHKCTGTLIDGEWVLTVAHCVDPGKSYSLGGSPFARIGSQRAEELRVSDVFLHPEYNGTVQSGSDIALLKLPYKVEQTSIQIAGSSYKPRAGDVPVEVGWWSDTDRSQTPIDLRMRDAEFVGSEQCSKFWDSLMDGMLCSSSRKEAICKGSSGAPLIMPHYPEYSLTKGDPRLDLLIGVASFGSPKCDGSRPDVSTNVAHFSEWIKSTISDRTDQGNGG